MPLRIHNTLARGEETFAPIAAGCVLFYTCGPTVYDFAHIGNFRSFLAADVLRRWLESPLCDRLTPDGDPEGHAFGDGGYRVRHVMNITDVGHMVDDDAIDGSGEDKMEAARKRLREAKKAGTLPEGVAGELDPDDPNAVASYYAGAFIADARTLGIRVASEADDEPALLPRATNHIRAMLGLVCTLLDRGHAYVGSDGVAYFDTSTFPSYGTLSGNTREAIRSGAGGRVDEATQRIKKHPADFMLWKPDPTHLMRWNPEAVLADDTEALRIAQQHRLGEGYPGWHLECSAMAAAVLDEQIDLHSGGEDNIFPHHECEIAQSCCAFGVERFARFWFHPRFLQVDGKKMSKSAGTFFTVRDLLGKGFTPAAIRLELIKTHYRQNANFTEQGLKDAGRMAERWRRFLDSAEASTVAGARNDEVARAFADAMNDDLSVGTAIGVINAWINQTDTPTRADAELLRTFDAVLGVLALPETVELDAKSQAGDGPTDAEIDAMVGARNAARASKDFAEADRLRDQLADLGIEITDGPDGTTWKRRAML
jgi:cysteinyl-tRNA synthetase